MKLPSRLQCILLAFSISLSLLVGEFALRKIAPHLLLSTNDNPTLRLDDTLGWTQIKPTIDIGSPDAKFSIYFLGDSFTDFDAQWPLSVIEKAKERGISARGAIGGVAGYGTYQEYLKLSQEFDAIKPDLVILLIFLWNDLRDNAAHPPIYYNLSTSRRPYLVPEGDSFIEYPVLERPWYRHLAITAAAFRVFQLLLNRITPNVDELTLAESDLPIDYSAPFTWMPFYLPETKSLYVENAWKSTEESLRRMQRFVSARHSQLCIVGIDNAFTVDDDVWITHVNDPRARKLTALERMKALADTLQIHYIDAQPKLVAARQKLGRKIYNSPTGNLSGHLEPEGEATLAEAATNCF